MTATCCIGRGAAGRIIAGLVVIATSANAQPVLRTAAEVQGLSIEQARRHERVRLRGVVTFTWHRDTTEFTIQDQTGAVWVPPMPLPNNCRFGSEIEIEGRTDGGVFGPFVRAESVTSIGPARLPAVRPVTYDELLAAPLHGIRVELTGIVRRQRVNPEFGLSWLALEIASGGGRVTVNVTHEIIGHPELIDAQVRIHGVNLPSTDAQQQAFLPTINAFTLADVQVVVPPNARPFAQPPTSLDNLMRSANIAGTGHQVRACGAVTFVGRGDSFFLQDGSRGIQVFLRESLHPVPGEIVDVAGFPEPGAFSPVLRDAEWRPTGARALPNPHAVKLAEAIKHDGRLITITGRLAELTPGDGEAVLTLEEGTLRCRVHILDARAQSWTTGSILSATGVCSVEIGDWESFVALRRPQGFSLLVQNAKAVILLRPAPWWTLTRLAWAIAAGAGILCCILGFVWLQTRTRLRETARTREAAHAQFVAVLAERNRIAREIHDTLAQGFTGISAQLEVLYDRLHDAPANLRRHLDLARELVRSSLDEARRSVWNLRAQALDEAGLVEALSRLGQQLTDDGKAAFDLKVEGSPRALPTDVENNLLRVGQEAITNAVRHSGAKRISLQLTFRNDQVRLAVTDDGKGFDPAQVHPTPAGGFGLAGLRERAAAMHASLEISRGPAGGTTIELSVPHV